MQLRSIETDARDAIYLILQIALKEGVIDYDAALRKRNRLEREIRESSATEVQKGNMLHSLSKVWMFLSEFIPEKVKESWRQKQDDSITPVWDGDDSWVHLSE